MPHVDSSRPVHLTGPNHWIPVAQRLREHHIGSPVEEEGWLACLPQCGYDRNQPLRRILSALEHKAFPSHQDPAVIYHFDERSIPRRSSVEMWIEKCHELFSGIDLRDFWETIWNMAVKAWDYIDLMGEFPRQAPYTGFPLFTPAFWKGSRRSRFLFQPFPDFLTSLNLDPAGPFGLWLETLLCFQYGLDLERMTLGLAALALNAPSETYLPGEILGVLPGGTLTPEQDLPPSISPGWRLEVHIPFGEENQSHPVHQFFWSEPITGLAAQCALLTIGSSDKGWLYLRGQIGEAEKQKDIGDLVLHRICTGLKVNPPPGGISRSWVPVGESGWPWLGCVSALIRLRQLQGV